MYSNPLCAAPCQRLNVDKSKDFPRAWSGVCEPVQVAKSGMLRAYRGCQQFEQETRWYHEQYNPNNTHRHTNTQAAR